MTPQADSIPFPPAREEFASPGGRYVLVVVMQGAPTEWMARGADAALYATGSGRRQQLWSRHLPHSFRPRTALVSDSGTVVLFDQWINVMGPHAVTVIDNAGRTVADHGFDDIARTLGVSRGTLARTSGKFGPWRAGEPTLDADGRSARVPAAGKTLTIRLSDGALGSAP